jgi:pimeloyl-ACP methyl ester carboxylesterase
MFGQLNACSTHDTSKIITNINCQTTIITGTNDILVNSIHSETLNQNIKNSKLIKIDNTGHMVQLERIEELSKIIVDTVEF